MSLAKSSKLGKEILVGGNDRTLYLFQKDTNGKSSCSGSCASAWPPLTTNGKTQAESGVSASMLGTTTRSDGSTQVTYNGHPLYYYSGDSSDGQVNGQGLNQFTALWYVVSAQGNAITNSVNASGGGSDKGSSPSGSNPSGSNPSGSNPYGGA